MSPTHMYCVSKRGTYLHCREEIKRQYSWRSSCNTEWLLERNIWQTNLSLAVWNRHDGGGVKRSSRGRRFDNWWIWRRRCTFSVYLKAFIEMHLCVTKGGKESKRSAISSAYMRFEPYNISLWITSWHIERYESKVPQKYSESEF